MPHIAVSAPPEHYYNPHPMPAPEHIGYLDENGWLVQTAVNVDSGRCKQAIQRHRSRVYMPQYLVHEIIRP